MSEGVVKGEAGGPSGPPAQVPGGSPGRKGTKMEAHKSSVAAAKILKAAVGETGNRPESVKELFKDVYGAFHRHYIDGVYAAEVVAQGFMQNDEIEVSYLNKWGKKHLGWSRFGIWFDAAIMAIVLGNAAEIYVETNDVDNEHTAICTAATHAFCAIFVLEFLIRISAMRRLYFYYLHNILDFFLALMAVMDTWVFPYLWQGNPTYTARMTSVLRVLRLMRVIRLVKLVRRIRPVWTLLRSMYAAMEPLLSALVLLSISLFSFGIFVTQLVGQSDQFEEKLAAAGFQDFGPGDLFGSVQLSMLTFWLRHRWMSRGGVHALGPC